jgi:hypothetical protein
MDWMRMCFREVFTDLPGSPVEDFGSIRSGKLRALSADYDVWNEIRSEIRDGVEIVVC